MSETYKIVRHYYFDGSNPPRVVKRGLTLAEARKHCNNDESASSTCKLAKNVRRTKAKGPWYDIYTKE